MLTIAKALRTAGDVANAVAMIAFGWAALSLQALCLVHFAEAGGIPRLDMGVISGIVADPSSGWRYLHLVFAWGYGVASVGCAWMTVLGLRWNYHLLIRVLNR